MAEYSVAIKASAVKELEKLPKDEIEKVLERIEALKEDPRPVGSTKLAIAELFRTGRATTGFSIASTTRQPRSKSSRSAAEATCIDESDTRPSS